MKRSILLSVITILTLTVNAQTLQFGFKGGINFAKESKTESGTIYSEDGYARTAFHVGGIMNYSLCKNWELEADLMYSMQGYKEDVYLVGSGSDKTIDYTVTSHYINLPIAVKFYPIKGLYLQCGPQLGYLLSKDDELEGDEVNIITTDKSKRFDFGIFGGVGYKFSNNIFVEGRYVHGLTGTMKEVKGNKNRNLQFSLGYMF